MYGAKELAEGFRTVRVNTIQIAQDIPADRYDFKAAAGVKSAGEMLLGVKEHAMHHRGHLMLIERMLGIVPHLTRKREAMAAARA
jgi:uncharacterized damage-inducible protein DinB